MLLLLSVWMYSTLAKKVNFDRNTKHSVFIVLSRASGCDCNQKTIIKITQKTFITFLMATTHILRTTRLKLKVGKYTETEWPPPR